MSNLRRELQKGSSRDEALFIREAIIDELEAINNYEKYIESSDNEEVREVLRDIRDEEKVHVGELIKLLSIVNPKEADLIIEGSEEVRELLEGER